MPEISAEQIGAGQFGGEFYSSPPSVTVTAPAGPQSTETVTMTWTYSSPLSKPQYSYRVQILDQFASAVLYDSGELLGTDTSFACPYLMSGGSSYTAKVIVSDAVDTGEGTLAFSSALEDIPNYPPEDGVGPIYEVAINGVGYRLADSPQAPYKRSAGQLQAPRYATGDTPFSEAIERYSFVGSGDWALGSGQRIANREDTSGRAYFDSENINPFDTGVRLLPASDELLSTAAGYSDAVVASDHLFAMTASDTVKRMTTPVATPDTMTFTGDTLVDLTSDGTYWYALNTDDEIFRGTDTTIGSVWSSAGGPTATPVLMEWTTDRLTVVYTNASSQSVLTTIAPDGTEEVAQGRFKYDDASIVDVTSGDGYMWYALNRGVRSVIYAWQLGSANAPFIALDLPGGEMVRNIEFYLGNVMIRCETGTGGTIYRAIPSSGELTPERVVDIDGVSAGTGPMVGLDRYVLFGWEDMSDDGRSGIGCIDLSTGGYARWIQAPTSTDNGAVGSVFVWDSLAGFTVDGFGCMYTSSTLSATGYVTSSVYDLASSLVKVVDGAGILTDPLPASSSVEMQVSYDSLTSFTSIGTLAVAGMREGSYLLGRQAQSVAYRLVLNASGSASPVVTMAQVKVHPLSVVDQMIELPISCAERQTGLNGVEIPESIGGVSRARTLESLVGTRVRLQDVDWPRTGVIETWEMVSAEFTSLGVWERSTGYRGESQAVCICTLRKAR